MSQLSSKRKKSKSKSSDKGQNLQTPSKVKEPKPKHGNKTKPESIKTGVTEHHFDKKEEGKDLSPKIDILGPNRFQVLSFHQVQKLNKIIDKTLRIKPNMSCLPTIEITLREFIFSIRKYLKDVAVVTKDIRINMDVASNIIGREMDTNFKMVDIIFTVSPNDISTQQKIKDTIFNILSEKLQQTSNGNFDTKSECEINEETIKDNYIRRMARVNNTHDPMSEAWSIISIGMVEFEGHIVEMKFIEKMKRQYEFTVDSFQIILDTLLAFSTVSRCSELTPNLFPTVVAECISGSFYEAIRHLKDRIIFTRQPEEICGGGLLKYCKLVTEGYKQDTSMDITSTEKYMCSRFFIDYPDLSNQKHKLESYLNIYFYDNHEKKSKFLTILKKVVYNASVSMMIHERSQTLQLIHDILHNISLDVKLKKSIVHLDSFNGRNWILDQVFYGTLYFPQEVYVINNEDQNNLSAQKVFGNQILICTGESSDVTKTNTTDVEGGIPPKNSSSLTAIQSNNNKKIVSQMCM